MLEDPFDAHARRESRHDFDLPLQRALEDVLEEDAPDEPVRREAAT